MTTLRGRLEEVRVRRDALEAEFSRLQAQLIGLRAEERSLMQQLSVQAATDELPVTRTDRVRRIRQKGAQTHVTGRDRGRPRRG